jgi:hypothetical protein
VGDNQDVAVFMVLKDLIDGGGDARLKVHGAFSTRHQIPVWLLDPPRPLIGKSLGNLVGEEPLPLAEVNLAQRLVGLWLRAGRGGDRLGGLECALQVAGVEAGKAPAGKSVAQAASLLAAFVRKRGVELALDAALVVPRRLPVANQQQARRFWLGLGGNGVVGLRREGIWKLNGDAGLRRLRARRSDLDIYTNFLLIRFRLGRSQEMHPCRHMAR